MVAKANEIEEKKNYLSLNFLLVVNKGVMEMKNKETENFNNSNITTETPSPKEQYNIILKLYKGLHENLEELYKKSKDKNSSTNASQLAYKVDRIASGLHYTLNFKDEKSVKISRNLRIKDMCDLR